jgi:integrase
VPVSPRLRFETVAGQWLERFEAKVAAGERHPRTLEAQLRARPPPGTGARAAGDRRAYGRRRRRAAGRAAAHGPVGEDLGERARDAPERDALRAPLRLDRRRPCGLLEHNERPRPTRRRQRVLGRAEIERLVGACAPRDRLMVTTVLYTGLRISEMLGRSGTTSTSRPA